MVRSQSSFSFLLLLTALLFTGYSLQAQKTPYSRSTEPLILDQKTVIPSKTLEPGSYAIRIVDQFSDRLILQIEDAQGKAMSTFIGLYSSAFDSSVASRQRGPIFWGASQKGAQTMRAFAFRNGNTLEFAYPKDQAVTLAKLNTNSVPAIDPASEGRKPDPKLTPEDREVVTLWMLKATRVGPKQETPAIEAKRYVAPATPTAAPVQSAAASSPVPPQAKQARPAPVQVAKLEPNDAPPRVHSSVRRLPQTASELPLIMLLSLLSLATAGGLRLVRRA